MNPKWRLLMFTGQLAVIAWTSCMILAHLRLEREQIKSQAFDEGLRKGWKLAVRKYMHGGFVRSITVTPGASLSGKTFIVVAECSENQGINIPITGNVFDSDFDCSNIELGPQPESKP